MRLFNKIYLRRPGQAPGTLEFSGEKKMDRVRFDLIRYRKEDFFEGTTSDISECLDAIHPDYVNWMNIVGLHNVDLVKEIGERFNLHPLLLEDVLTTDRRAKIEEYEDQHYAFIIIRMFYRNQKGELQDEQVSLVLGPHYVISFQEREEDVFGPVRERLRKGGKRINKAHADYLTYALLDAIVDGYFVILDALAHNIENLEDEILLNPKEKHLSVIHDYRTEIMVMRKATRPMLEMLSHVEKEVHELFSKDTLLYLRDLLDHSKMIADQIETLREQVNGLYDMHMTTVNNRMNQVMKVLTVIATIFIPLTFITGLYGMNFENMPELHFKYGYFILWGIMISLVLTMIIYFRRKRWI